MGPNIACQENSADAGREEANSSRAVSVEGQDPWMPDHDGLMSAEAATWAIRFFLGREPSNEAEVLWHRKHPDLNSMRKAFSQTPVFKDFLASNGPRQPYRAPLFLLAQPADSSVPWKFEPPTLEQPVSQLCTAAQVESPEFLRWIGALRLSANFHRKEWEFAYLCAVLDQAGMLGPGKRGLGFGVGRERLVSLLAQTGVDVVATDAPGEIDQGVWDINNQHSSELEQLHYPDIVDIETFYEHVTFQPADMNAIPEEFQGFDFCWSACAFEHLGSIQKGLDFFENSMRCLKPGGLAVHTTEFNLSSNDATFESKGLSIFRKQDIEALIARLTRAGHRVLPLNLHPGDREVDAHIDLPPWALPHLKLTLASYTCTSIGIAAFKA